MISKAERLSSTAECQEPEKGAAPHIAWLSDLAQSQLKHPRDGFQLTHHKDSGK